MPKEYTLPSGAKKRHGDAFKIRDVGSFPSNWLEHASLAELFRVGITVTDIPEPVKEPPTLARIKLSAKNDAPRLLMRALVKAQTARAHNDIDAAQTPEEVRAVLDGLA
jgi:hypothetical protein